MRTHRYGEDPDQVVDVYLAAATGAAPTVVLLHGGFWRLAYGRELMTGLARQLAAAGVTAVNAEYRRVGQPGGGWPGTFTDVAAAVDAAAELTGVSPSQLAVVGHSAGGHLALWVAARHRLPGEAPGAMGGGRVAAGGAAAGGGVAAAVSLAGVTDLETAVAEDLGGGAARALLGASPQAEPERYALASPRRLLPTGVATLLVHGGADDRVPLSQSRAYLAAARAAGDHCELLELAGADHFTLIDPGSAAWQATKEWLFARLG